MSKESGVQVIKNNIWPIN